MKKQFFAAAMILALGAGFTACSNDDLGKQEGKEVARNADTYMSVSFTLPKASATRAAADGQDETNPNFNYIGTWSGADDIKSVNIYVFDGTATTNTLEALEKVSSPLVTTVDGNLVVKSPQPFKISAGEKRVFVVVNPTDETDAHLNAVKGTTTLSEFTQKYATDELSLTLPTGTGATASTVAEMLAKRTDDKEAITMTGSYADKTLASGVSSSEAASGAANNVNLTVKRVVASVVVSSKEASYTFGANDPTTSTIKTDFVKVSDLSYVVAQGEKKLYLVQASNTTTADGAAFKTPSYSYISDADNYGTTAPTWYDYSGLKANEPGRKTDGFAVHTLADHTTTGLTPKFTKSVFVLPTVHKFNTEREKSGYRKGNTPYVLVRGYLTPEKVVGAAGVLENGENLAQDADLYYGETTGFFYKSSADSQDATHKGVKGQKVRKFKKRVVLYWAWLNPDGNNVNSPVIRNNIYNIHITAIKNLGGNWNPLVPNKPGDPNNPENPNPKPNDNPNEPDTPPVNPNDPLTLDKTWMSTNVTVLPWQVHSREIELSL